MSWPELFLLSLFSSFGTFMGMAVGVFVLLVLSIINDRISEDRERQAERERTDVRNN